MHSSISDLERQPSALKFLFLTEMWERFAYFAVQSILVLFMSKALGLSDNHAYLIFSAFGALLFVMPLVGGYLADNFLGYTHAIILGMVFLSIGYFLLAAANLKLLPCALAILILGNGFFKPNISALLGSMYESGAKNREAGFMIFYLGINVGATMGVILCGFLAKSFGWSFAIATAATGLLVGGTMFLFSRKRILNDACITANSKKLISSTLLTKSWVYVLIIPTLVALWLLMQYVALVSLIVLICATLLIFYLSIVWFKCSKTERNKFSVCLVLVIFSIAFWALYQQSFMSVMLYLERLVNLKIFGIVIPPSVVSSFNGIFLIVLAPCTIKFWAFLRRKNKEPNVIIKFVLGILLMGIGYLIIAFDTNLVSATKLAPLSPIVFSYAIQTLGELLLSPVGLAMITVLSPQKIRGLMMGVWFFALAAATTLAGQLAKLTENAANLAKPMAAIVYGHAFVTYGGLAVIIALLLFFSSKRLERLIAE
ncbi:MAG: hypothetical protein A2X78_04180 [Gammaproteobacteria bacterium GWE2_37_16]|nr:MAG: hypothetical protein A2X78_04180 [Gammaproteobacteria bacterium GWE2_37_16]